MPAPTIDAEFAELAEEFGYLDDWEERYRHLIDLGRALPELPEAERTDTNKVRGCASQVWLVSEREGERLRFRGDSDAHIVRGLVAVVLRLADARSPAELTAFDFAAAFDRLGLAGALSTQRANGLASMVARIEADAAAAG